MKKQDKLDAQDEILHALSNLIEYNTELNDDQVEYIRKQGFTLAKKFKYIDGFGSLESK